MQAAFDRDCCLADEVYVVGYSLGDEHINESLKTALRHNPKLKVTVIDPGFLVNKMDYEFALHLFPFKHQGNMEPKKVRDNVYNYFADTFAVYTIGLREFLESR